MVFDIFKSRRRARLRAQPVPRAWRTILERNLPVFSRLSAADQAELIGHTQVFLAEKHFEGAGGLELTDEIRVTIAGQACLLLLHRETEVRPRSRAQFSIGESVKVISGPLSDFSGEISEINEDAGRLKVLVSIFGRETPVEVGFDQVKKI